MDGKLRPLSPDPATMGSGAAKARSETSGFAQSLRMGCVSNWRPLSLSRRSMERYLARNSDPRMPFRAHHHRTIGFTLIELLVFQNAARQPGARPAKLSANLRSKSQRFMCINIVLAIGFALALIVSAGGAETSAQSGSADPARQLREYRDVAMGHDGNAARGRDLFNDEQRTACVKCHSVDGSSSKAGPDLFAVGDKFPRRELIRAVLEPQWRSPSATAPRS